MSHAMAQKQDVHTNNERNTEQERTRRDRHPTMKE